MTREQYMDNYYNKPVPRPEASPRNNHVGEIIVKQTLWQDKALCRGLPSELFYSDDEITKRIALRYCGPCVVRQACLEHALITNEKHGIWGGKTPSQRTRIRTRLRKSSRQAGNN